MKKRYLVVILLIMLFGLCNVKALVVGDCKVLLSFKLNSSLDEDSYICKGRDYGISGEAIYYDNANNTVYFNNLNAYYLSNWDENVTINLAGSNNISLLHLSDVKVKITGDGSLKFKQNSFVKKVSNGEPIYTFIYKGKVVLNESKKIFEGQKNEFEDNYDVLKSINGLPKEYNESDYVLEQATDYTKMNSVVVTDSWLTGHITTNLESLVEDGFGIVRYVVEDKKEEESETNNVLQTENVIFISDQKVDKKYQLKEEDLKEKEVAEKVNENLDDKDLISLYDVSVYNGKQEVLMKNGKYTIKIKLDESSSNYDDYQIIYVSDDGEIVEYIDGYIEDGYIVFETTHLSHYGVIANPVEVEVVNTKRVDWNLIAKLLIIVGFITFSLITWLIIVNCYFHATKRRKRTKKAV